MTLKLLIYVLICPTSIRFCKGREYVLVIFLYFKKPEMAGLEAYVH